MPHLWSTQMIITIKSDLPFDDIFAKTTSTNTESETPTKRPEGQSGLASTTTVVGLAVGLVGAVCLGLLGALGIYIRRKRRTHDATLHPFSTLDEGEIPIFQSTGALSGKFNIRIFSRLRFDSPFSSNRRNFSRGWC